MALPHFGTKFSTSFIEKECKYCGESVTIYLGFTPDELEIKSQMDKHINDNDCLSKYRESRLGKMLD